MTDKVKQISIEDLIQKFLFLELGTTSKEALDKLRVDLIQWSDYRCIEGIEENELLKKKFDFIKEQNVDLCKAIRHEKRELKRLWKILEEELMEDTYGRIIERDLGIKKKHD